MSNVAPVKQINTNIGE